MDVICDTNIWYNIGSGNIIPEKNKDVTLWGTFLSIDELSKTGKLLNPDLRGNVRSAIQEMIKNKKVLYEPPFFKILVESSDAFEYDPVKKDGKLLEFTQLIANHHDIEEEENKAKFREYVVDRKSRIQAGTDFFTELIENHKETHKNKGTSKGKDNSVVIREFIKLIIKSVTKEDLPNDFDWTMIELFEKTLDYYFKKLETTSMKIKNNDWLDLAFLVYVRPGQKIWTQDRRLKTLIKECGLSDYLYEQ